MYVAEKDIVATIYDGKWAKKELGEWVVNYTEIPDFTHSCFNFGKDSTYQKSIAKDLSIYNPLPSDLDLPCDCPNFEYAL
jgi:hypothetical protein